MHESDRWRELGIGPDDRETLARHAVPGLDPEQQEQLRAALWSRARAAGGPGRFAGLRVAWMQIRLQPLLYIGGSLILWSAGTLIAMAFQAQGVTAVPLVVWPILAPWMAFMAIFGPGGWRTGALGRILAAAPIQPWQARVWQSMGLGALNLLFMAILSVTGLGGVGIKVLLEWWIPFALAGGVLLWITTWPIRPRIGMAMVAAFGAADSALVLLFGALWPAWIAQEGGVPFAAWLIGLASTAVLASGILARIRTA